MQFSPVPKCPRLYSTITMVANRQQFDGRGVLARVIPEAKWQTCNIEKSVLDKAVAPGQSTSYVVALRRSESDQSLSNTSSFFAFCHISNGQPLLREGCGI